MVRPVSAGHSTHTETHGAALAALLLLAGAVLVFPKAGEAPLERAEIYFVDVARAMVESGDYLVPRYRGEPFFDKPPLTYWLMAAAFEQFGFTLAAARLVSGLAALGTVLATVILGRQLQDASRAQLGGVVLVTTLAFTGFGRVAMSDMLLAFWNTLAMALMAGAFGEAKPIWRLPALGVALGLGFLTKGPIALLLGGFGLLLLLRRDARRLPSPRPVWLATGVALCAAIGLSWFALVYGRAGIQPLEHFFLRENLARFAGDTYDSDRAPWYYLLTYLGEGLPWSVFFPIAALRLIRERRSSTTAGARLLALWLASMALPLSLSRGKIDYYLLPLYPAAALVVGDFLAAAWSRSERLFGRLALAAFAGCLALTPSLPFPFPDGWLPDASVRLALRALCWVLALALAAVSILFSPLRAWAALAASSAAVFVAVAGFVIPAFRAAQPNRAIVADVQRELLFEPAARLVFCDDPARVERDLLFETRVAAVQRCDLWAMGSSRPPFLLMLRKSDRGGLLEIPDIRLVGEYPFVPATALTLRGLSRGEPADALVILANYWTKDRQAAENFRLLRRRLLREAEEAGTRR